MMLALSVILTVLPLIGIVWGLTSGLITTVDGLFMSLILLMLSGVFALNVLWEARDMGLIKKKTATPPPAAAKPAPAKTT